MKKKSISPLVTVLLLVLVSVILISTFFYWSRHTANKQLGETTKQLNKSNNVECINSNLKVDDCYFSRETNEFFILLTNSSHILFTGLTLTIEGRSKTTNKKIRWTGVSEEIIRPGDSVLLNADNNFVENYVSDYKEIDFGQEYFVLLTNETCKDQIYNLICDLK